MPRHLLSLWMPMLAAMTLQSLYAIVDLIFVRELGDAAISGLAVTVQAFFIILAIGQILGQTALAEISQAYGQNDLAHAKGAASSYAILSLGLGIPAAILAYLGAEAYVGLFTDDPDIFREGVTYFAISAPTFLLQLVIIVFSTSVRASGDFVSPMRIMIISVLLNAALDPILIFGLDMGIAGAAWATVIAQLVSCLTYVYRLSKKSSDPRALTFGRPAFRGGLLRRVLTRGLPAGVQFFLIFVLLGIILAGMKPFGGEWTGASGGGFRILQQTWLPLVTLASAAAALSGQNFGARHGERVRETAKVAMRWGLIYGSVSTVVVMAAAPLFAHLAAESETQHGYATTYFLLSAPMLFAFTLTYIPTFILQAVGRSFWPMIAAFIRVGVVAVATFLVVPALGWGPEAILIASTLAAFIEGVIGIYLLRRFLVELRTVAPNPQPVPAVSAR